jgi:oligogalacturonide lyase
MLSVIPAGLAGAAELAQRNQLLPAAGEFVRFSDPATEAPVVRLTSPAYNNVLPASQNRFVFLKPRVLYCSSDRAGGRMAPFQVDLRTGAIRQVAESASLDATSLSVDAAGRSLYFLDGGALREVPVTGRLNGRRPDVLADGVSTFGMGVSRSELFAIRSGRLERIAGSERVTLAEEASEPCVVRPGGRGCLFGRRTAEDQAEFWYASSGKPLLVAKGRITNPYWSVDGESLLFLREVPYRDNIYLAELREVIPGETMERGVAQTSQFATFAANGNDSMFVGASKSRAQPNVVLLLRTPHRELTLCEHRASRPADVRPAFSPDSRRVYFQTDREGKLAIYSVNVETLVEPTQ